MTDFTYPRDVPVLETERLRLRAHRREDLAAMTALWTDPQVTRFIGGRTSTPEEIWARLTRYVGLWPLLGYGYWAVVRKSDESVIGEMGFADFGRELEPSIAGVPELGWSLQARAHGQGYATEALRAAYAWGDARWPGERTVCMIDPDNAPSLRVAAKLGFREVVHTTYKGSPTILFERILSLSPVS